MMKKVASWNNLALETGLHRLWNSQTMKIKREWTLNTLLCAYCKEIMDHYRSRGSGRIWAKCSLVGTKSVHLRPFSDCTARDFGRRSPSFTLFWGIQLSLIRKYFYAYLLFQKARLIILCVIRKYFMTRLYLKCYAHTKHTAKVELF